AVIAVLVQKRGAVGPQSRHVVGAAGVLVAGLFPVQPAEPVQAAARLGREPQLVRPALGIRVVFVELHRRVAAGEGGAPVGRIAQAGEALVGTRGWRVTGRTRTAGSAV